jgi:adenylate cyclase
VRITAQLVDATTGADLWAQHYDQPLRDIFSLQDEIVQRIVTTLNLQLNLTEKGFRVVKRTDNLEAYDYFLRGTEFSFNSASLGFVLYVDHIQQWSHDLHDLDRAIQLEQQSITLDNANASAYAVMSVLYASKRRYDLSIAAAERALTFNRNSAQGYGSMALALTSSGKPTEAVVAAQ